MITFRNREAASALFVAGTWLAMSAAAYAYVLTFATPVFIGDEWDLVSGLTYSEPYFPWLWAQHNEHRLPLPKLAYNVLLNLSGFDARTGGLATVTILSALALGLILTARRLRGSIEYADAFFPVLLLNWGHFEDFLMGFQLSFALSIGLACAWMISAFGRRRYWHFCLVMLPLCGAHGLLYVAPLSLATIWLQRRDTSASRLAGVIAVAIAAALSLLYFRGYHSPPDQPRSAGVAASLLISGEVLALGWGWAGQMAWPASGALSGAFIVATAILAGLMVRIPARRDDVVIVAAVAAGSISLALGIGWGRSGFGPLAGFAVRYALLCAPLMAAAYLAWVRFGGPLFGSLVPMLMLTVVGLLLTQHARTGLAEGKSYAASQREFMADLRAGLPLPELTRRHTAVYPYPDRFAERLRVLQSAGVRRYASTQPMAATAVTHAP